jgi:hypothetical protein
MKKIILFSLVLLILGSCNNNSKSQNQSSETQDGAPSFVVLESINAAGYVYILGDENGTKRWFAITAREVQKGDVFFYENPLIMKDFFSKELDRPFDEVLFLSQVTRNPSEFGQDKPNTQKRSSGKITTGQLEIQMVTPEGSMSIAQLYENKEKLKGQKVKVHGQVTKFSPEIMNTNWIHLQDGTTFKGKYDLTITSGEVVKVGDIITFEGAVAVDKDFGYGYFYELLIEKARTISKTHVK